MYISFMIMFIMISISVILHMICDNSSIDLLFRPFKKE